MRDRCEDTGKQTESTKEVQMRSAESGRGGFARLAVEELAIALFRVDIPLQHVREPIRHRRVILLPHPLSTPSPAARPVPPPGRGWAPEPEVCWVRDERRPAVEGVDDGVGQVHHQHP